MSFEAYKVGITLSLTNHVSKALLAMQGDLARADSKVVALRKSLQGIEKLALGGAIVGGIGFMGLKAIGDAVKPAEEYVHQLELAKAAGLSQLEIANATAAAWRTTGDVMTTTATDNLKAIRELRMVFGSTAEAVGFLPQMQKIQAVLDSALHGEGGVAAKDVAFTAAKALELRGASATPEAFREQADMIVKAVIASGGRFNPAMLLQAQKYGGIGATGYSNEFMYGILPSIAQELGGSSTGTMLTSMHRAIVGGRIDKKALPVWQSLGLLDSVKSVTGETAMVQAKNAAIYQENPLHYMQYVQGQLVARGITDLAEQQVLLERMFSNRVAGRGANIFATQGGRLEKDFNLINQAGTSAEYDRLVKSDPMMARAAAAAQWENLKTVIGLEVVPILIPAIKGLADSLQTLTKWARENPTTVKALTLAFGGLFTAMLAGGSLMLIVGGFKSLGLLLGSKGGVATGVAGLTLALNPLALALISISAVIGGIISQRDTIKKHISDPINETSWGQKLGDELMDDSIKARQRAHWREITAPKQHPSFPPIHTTVTLDGRNIAEAITPHQERAMSKPSSGTSFFDIGKTMAGPSASHAQ